MRVRATHRVIFFYALAALVYTWPLALAASHAIPVTGTLQDARFQAYLLGWDWHALATHPLHVFDAPIFHPEPNTLTYMDHMLGEAIVGAPVYAATRSVAAAYDFLVWFGFVVAAWAMYRLARACGASRPGAWIAGFLYSFSPYHFSNLGQLNVLQIEALPLALWLALRCLERGRTRDWLALAAAGLFQLWLGWYYTFYLAIALGVLAAFALVRVRRAVAPIAWGRVTLALGLFAALALPVVLPYLAEQHTLREFHRTLEDMDSHSAGLGAYGRVNAGAVAARWMPVDGRDEGYWVGLATLLLVVLGLALAGRRRTAGSPWTAYFAWLAVAGFVLALGPYLHGPHHANLHVPLPYLFLYKYVPGFASMRAPGRLAVLVLLGLALLAGLGFDAGRRALAARSGAMPARAFAAIVAAIALIEPWQRPLALAELPTAATMPPVYAWLAKQPGAPPVLEVPTAIDAMNESERDILRQYLQLFHGKPRLDGASGFVSARYRAFRAQMRDFPAQPAGLDTARALGAEIVIVHWGDYAPPDAALRQKVLDAQERLVTVATFGTDVAYRFR